MLALYRRSDGSEWGGQDLEEATGRTVTRSYVSNLKSGRIANPGLDKLEAIAGAMGFPPQLWFGDRAYGAGAADEEALLAATRDATRGAMRVATTRQILEEALRLGPRDRRLLLRLAKQVGTPPG